MCEVNRHWREVLVSSRLWAEVDLDLSQVDAEGEGVAGMAAWVAARAQVRGGRVWILPREGGGGGGVAAVAFPSAAGVLHAAAQLHSAPPAAGPQGIRELTLRFDRAEDWADIGFMLGLLRPTLRRLWLEALAPECEPEPAWGGSLLYTLTALTSLRLDDCLGACHARPAARLRLRLRLGLPRRRAPEGRCALPAAPRPTPACRPALQTGCAPASAACATCASWS